MTAHTANLRLGLEGTTSLNDTERMKWFRGKRKEIHVWIPKEDGDKLTAFLDKFSAGDTETEQLKNFLHARAEKTRCTS